MIAEFKQTQMRSLNERLVAKEYGYLGNRCRLYEIPWGVEVRVESINLPGC